MSAIRRLKKPSLGERNPGLAKKIAAMRLTLHPIYPCHLYDGPPHTSFPATLLHFWLLTEDQMDRFAHYYCQSTPGPSTNLYPAMMNWDKDFLARPKLALDMGNQAYDDAREEWQLSTADRMSIKRRMVGKFIGLRGCATPLWEMEAKLRWLEKTVARQVEEEWKKEQRMLSKFV